MLLGRVAFEPREPLPYERTLDDIALAGIAVGLGVGAACKGKTRPEPGRASTLTLVEFVQSQKAAIQETMCSKGNFSGSFRGASTSVQGFPDRQNQTVNLMLNMKRPLFLLLSFLVGAHQVDAQMNHHQVNDVAKAAGAVAGWLGSRPRGPRSVKVQPHFRSGGQVFVEGHMRHAPGDAPSDGNGWALAAQVAVYGIAIAIDLWPKKESKSLHRQEVLANKPAETPTDYRKVDYVNPVIGSPVGKHASQYVDVPAAPPTETVTQPERPLATQNILPTPDIPRKSDGLSEESGIQSATDDQPVRATDPAEDLEATELAPTDPVAVDAPPTTTGYAADKPLETEKVLVEKRISDMTASVTRAPQIPVRPNRVLWEGCEVASMTVSGRVSYKLRVIEKQTGKRYQQLAMRYHDEPLNRSFAKGGILLELEQGQWLKKEGLDLVRQHEDDLTYGQPHVRQLYRCAERVIQRQKESTQLVATQKTPDSNFSFKKSRERGANIADKDPFATVAFIPAPSQHRIQRKRLPSRFR